MKRAAPLLAWLALSACSPVYVYKAASGHVRLLVHRRSIKKTIDDPKTPAELKAKLALVLETRRFAFGEMGLKASGDYTTWSKVDGEMLTWLVEAAPKLELKPYLWRFPLVGSFPYKGYFKEADARVEARKMEGNGYDATITGAAAYKTPLWISDPVPSSALAYSSGELSDLIIHELAHGTVFFKNQTQFDETLAVFVGQTGAQQFLSKRFGPDSQELSLYRKSLDDERKLSAVFDAIYGELDALYKSSATAEAKLAAREKVFAAGLERIKRAGFDYSKLNNAVLLAHRVYHDEEGRAALQAAFDGCGGDWVKFIALLESLDAKAPSAELRRRLKSSTGP